MNSRFQSATASFLAVTLSFASLTACASENKVSAESTSAPPPATAPATPSGQTAAPAAPPAATPVQTASYRPAGQDPANQPPPDPNQAAPPLMNNDELVAPIALYPDALLAQVLASATNPQEVLDAGNWLLQNQSLKGDAVVSAAEKAGFTPSVQYLVSFPQVVDQMCQEINWTTQLGEAFKADPKGVLAAVQIRRREAQKMGNLATTPQMVVDTKTDSGQQVIEIRPANPTVVYVPQYNPVTVYTTPAPPQTVVVQQGVSTGTAVGIGLLSFGVGMAVGAMISRPNYYPYPSWGYGGMYYGGRPYYPPPYRPVYPGYRPAYGYHPPPNYHWNQYNRQTNVTVNNNYYNNFNKTNVNNNYNKNNFNQNNVNNRPANQNPNNRQPNQLPAGTQNGNNRPAANNQGNTGAYNKGQTAYQGTRPNTNGNQRPGSGMANANPTATGQRPNTGNRPNNGNTANTMSRPTTANANAGSRPNNGTGSTGSRPQNQTAARPANQPNARPANPQQRPQNQTMSRQANTGAPKGAGGGKPTGGGKSQGGKPTGRQQPKPQ